MESTVVIVVTTSCDSRDVNDIHWILERQLGSGLFWLLGWVGCTELVVTRGEIVVRVRL
jgi:hypothetical protein